MELEELSRELFGGALEVKKITLQLQKNMQSLQNSLAQY